MRAFAMTYLGATKQPFEVTFRFQVLEWYTLRPRVFKRKDIEANMSASR